MKFVRQSHMIEARNKDSIDHAVDAFYELPPAVRSTIISVVVAVTVIILACLLRATVYVIAGSNALQF